MKLTKQQAADHRRACDLVASDRPLTIDEKWFVLTHWHEAGNATHTLDGAFFTPTGLATCLALHAAGRRIIDLGAGIGRLTWAFYGPFERIDNGVPAPELVCVERNPAYVEVGRRVLPEATWICADLFALPDLGRFDCAISNPPFGATARSGSGPRYRGRRVEYHVIDIARDLADRGVFIVPQTSAPFRYSGRPNLERGHGGDEYRRFVAATGITLGPSVGVDTTYYRNDWRGVTPTVELVVCDFAGGDDQEMDDLGDTVRPDGGRVVAASAQGALFSL